MKRVAAVCVLLAAALASYSEESSGSIVEIVDTVVESAAPAETAAPSEGSGAAETSGSAGQTAAAQDAAPGQVEAIGQEPGQAKHEEAEKLRAEAKAVREELARVTFKRTDFEEQVKRNEVHLQKTADEIAAQVSQPVVADSAAAREDSLIAARRGKIAKHRTLIADLQIVVDSLSIEEKRLTAKAEGLEQQAQALDGKSDRDTRRAEAAQDARPYGARCRVAFGCQSHYLLVKDADGDYYGVRNAGFMLSFAIRPYLIVGVRDLMLFFNETVRGDRVGVTFSPFVGAALNPARRLQLEGALGALTQIQTGMADDENDGTAAVAPYVSLSASLWPLRHFSIGLVSRFAYMATGALQAGAVPSERSDVIPYQTLWFDLGLSLSFHF
jgi:hypothetical protein